MRMPRGILAWLGDGRGRDGVGMVGGGGGVAEMGTDTLMRRTCL